MASRYIDYKLKADVLKTGITKTISKVDAQNYLYHCDGIIPSKDLENEYIDILFQYGYKYIKEARKINNASFKRVERLKERISSYLSKGRCIWLTLTFSNDLLASTSKDTRRKYVSRFLKSQSDYYVANIDYGAKKGREHYHAVVVSNHIDTKWWRDNCGGTKCVIIKNHIGSDTKLSKYVAKLTNHAIKKTTQRQCYIYSRCK